MTGVDGGADPGARPGWRWDVALSFAGAQRDYVEQVARALQARGVRCFYDADEQIELWGKYLAEELPTIYGEQAAAVVVFASAEYAARDWTRQERRAALGRAVRERREYVLPARFDDTPLPGLLSDVSYIDLRTKTPQQFAAMIADKLAALGIAPLAPLADAGNPAQDAGSACPAAAVPGDQRPAARPQQLPLAPERFTGRDRELTVLTSALAASANAGRTVVISAIGGTAGIGKTALALHWAHANAHLFPDGQLYFDLHGFGPSAEPTLPEVAVRAFLDALGMPAAKIPAGLDAQAGLFRSLVAGRQMLIVLDNARDMAQVDPLLPGSPPCAVLVTSRSQLAALQVRGATLLDLDVLSEREALDLLAGQLGEERLAAEPAAVTELLCYCGGLPLALGIVAARAALQPDFPLAVLADELRDTSSRLDALDAGDTSVNLRAVFSSSYATLDPATASIFRLLGLAPGPDVSLPAAASLAGQPIAQTRALLRKLERAYLVQQYLPGRYRMHDLVRLYSAEQADRSDARPRRRAALTRLFDYYISTAAAAMDAAFPAERYRRSRIEAPSASTVVFADSADAMAWLASERPNLVAMAVHTAERGWPRYTVRLAAIIRRYLETAIGYTGYSTDALTVHGHALTAAHNENDRAGEAAALQNLGTVYFRSGRYEEALESLTRALSLRRDIGDRGGEANTLDNLGGVYWGQGRLEEALDYYRQALALNQEVGDRPSEGRTLNNLGVVCVSLGRYNEAVSHLEQALDVASETGDRPAFGTLNNMGVAYERLGRYEQALDVLQQGLRECRESSFHSGEAATLDSLGVVFMRLGRHDEALERHREAIALALKIGDRGLEAEMLNNLGETLKEASQPEEALTTYQSAFALSTEIGNSYQAARALDGMAQILHSVGRLQDARRHWQQAVRIYTDLGVPDAEAVRACLTALDDSGRDHNDN